MLSTVPGQNNTRFSNVYLKRFKRFLQKNRSIKYGTKYFVYLRVHLRKIKTLKSVVVPNIHRPTKKTKYISYLYLCFKATKFLQLFWSCYFNDFGKLFSARPCKLKVTLETKIFRFAPKINFNCCGFSILFH